MFLAPARALTRDHLSRAKAILDQFEVVIVLERFEAQMVQLQSVFRWSIGPDWRSGKRTTAQPRVNLTADAIGLLRDRNQLDTELYEHAAQLAEKLTAAATKVIKGEKTADPENVEGG